MQPQSRSGLRSLPALVRWPAAGGILLLILICYVRGQDWQFTFDVNGNLSTQTPESIALPQIVAQPQPQVVKPGELASFFVVVADTRGLAYQWRTNGVNLSGATSDALLLTNVTALNQGLYSVVLSNSSGSLTSAPAMLWIDSDGDDLPDSWEQTYFGNLNSNPTGDADGDGISNANEFSDGTNPTNSASALFRLSLFSDGGSLAANPTKLAYTNGESVTVTVTPLGSEIFRFWTGDILSRSNSLSLVMTNNKTLFAHFGGVIFSFTNSAGGSWHNPTNWNPNLVPAALDDIAPLPAVTITINAPAECHDLTFTGGTLTGTGDLSIYGNAIWSTSGTMSGSGRTIIAPGATLTMSSPSFTLDLARSLENGGTVVWTGAAGMNVNNVVISNRAGALFHAQSALTMGSSGGSPRFDNAGTFRKSGNSGTTAFNFAFNNYGDMDLQIGTVQHSGSFVNNGSVTVAAGATHRMATSGSGNGTFSAPSTALVEWTGGTFTLTTGAQLNGAGTYRIIGATLNCDADFAVQNLEVTSTLGGSGAVTISNAMSWTAGTPSGSGRTIIAPGATLTINSPFFTMTLARTLENAGTVVWAGLGGMNVNNVTITNRVGALFQAQTALTMGSGGGTPRFDNAGTFRKSADSGTTTFTIPFNDYGSVETLAGTLSLNGGGSHIGSFVVTNGAGLNFAGTHNLSAAASIVGAGTLSVSSGTFTHLGFGNVTGLNSFSGGAANLNGEYICTNNTVSVSGGTVNFNGTGLVSPATVTLSSGTLSGSSLITVLQTMNWTSGTMSGSGRTIIAPGATLTMNSPAFTLDLARPLENAGTVVWLGNPGMNVNNVVITNRAGALFHVQNAVTLGSSGGSPRFDNAGTFRKSANSGTTAFNIPFNNYGDVDLQIGTVQHNSSFVNAGSVALAAGTTHRLSAGGSATGTFTNPPTAVVEWLGGTFTLNTGAQLNGAGLYRINATLVCNPDLGVTNLDLSGTLDGPGIVTVHNVMNWYGGTMSGSGRTVIATGATLNAANSPFTVNLNSRVLENGGTILWTGVGISLSSTFITNRAGALFHAQNAQSLTGGGSSRFDNTGTFRKSINTGTTFLGGGMPFNNYGTVEVQTGTLYCVSSFLNNGAATLAAGAALQIAAGGSANGTFTNSPTALVEWLGGTFTLNTGAQLNGAGLYRINGSTLNCNADVTVQNLDLPSGTLDGSGVVTISNAMTWSGGSLSGSGRTIIAPGATMTINNPFFTISLNRTLENGGTVLWTGAAVYVNNVAITNRVGALFHVQSAPTFYNTGGAPRFDNAGTFRKSADSGTTTFGIPLNNYATLDIRSGIVSLSGNFFSASNATLNCALGGTTAGTGHGQLQKSGTITLDGALSVDLLPGFTPAINDTFTVVNAGTRSGTFSSFSYPANRVAMTMSNSPSAVILRVTNVLAVPAPVLLTPEIVGTNARLSWSATTNVTYRLERISDVGSTNWAAIAGDVTTSSNTASKLDTLTLSNRFYRVRALP